MQGGSTGHIPDIETRKVCIVNSLAIIHIAKKELGLDAVAYEAMLSRFGKESSKDLNEQQRLELIDDFKKLGFTIKSDKPLRYSHLSSDRRNDVGQLFASPGQLRMIEAMWMSSAFVKKKTVEAMNSFIKRIAAVETAEWLLMKDVRKVVKAIKNLSSSSETNINAMH